MCRALPAHLSHGSCGPSGVAVGRRSRSASPSKGPNLTQHLHWKVLPLPLPGVSTAVNQLTVDVRLFLDPLGPLVRWELLSLRGQTPVPLPRADKAWPRGSQGRGPVGASASLCTGQRRRETSSPGVGTSAWAYASPSVGTSFLSALQPTVRWPWAARQTESSSTEGVLFCVHQA